MTTNYATLAQYPDVFQAISGLSVPAFAALVEEITPAHAAAELLRKSRTDRRNRIGGGAPPRLNLADRVLVSLIGVRFGAREHLELIFGVGSCVLRVSHFRPSIGLQLIVCGPPKSRGERT